MHRLLDAEGVCRKDLQRMRVYLKKDIEKVIWLLGMTWKYVMQQHNNAFRKPGIMEQRKQVNVSQKHAYRHRTEIPATC